MALAVWAPALSYWNVMLVTAKMVIPASLVKSNDLIDILQSSDAITSIICII